MLIASPWIPSVAAEEGREYLALLLYLPLKRLSALPRFSWGAFRIVGQLRRSEGLIGYSLGVELGSLEFWSLSVWEDEESLRKFVHSAPHVRVMKAMEPHVGRTEHARWKVDGTFIPPGWKEAKRRMQEH